MTKAEIRSLQKELRYRLSKEEQELFSEQIRDRLLTTRAYLASNHIFTFVSFTDEVDTHGIITESLKRGKRVYVPRIEARKMEFYQITDLDHLVRSKFGILEPEACEENRFPKDTNCMLDASLTNNQEFRYDKLMLLPGLAFDRNGNRIGYGAGYYDKYLSSFPQNTFYKLALAFDFQIMDYIPSEEYDRRVDTIITPVEIHICNPR